MLQCTECEADRETDSKVDREANREVVFICANRVRHPEEIDTDRVFERFFKTDKARTHTSTGLGLSIAKELAERMQGTMEAEVIGDWFEVSVRFKRI